MKYYKIDRISFTIDEEKDLKNDETLVCDSGFYFLPVTEINCISSYLYETHLDVFAHTKHGHHYRLASLHTTEF